MEEADTMRKALLYGLSLAMLLSLAACGKPQVNQQDTSQPDTATTSAAASEPVQEPTTLEPVTPEPVKDTPDTEPPVTFAPEPPADPAPVVEPKPEQPPVTPVKKDTPKPMEETPTPDPVGSEEVEEQPSEAEKLAEEAPNTESTSKPDSTITHSPEAIAMVDRWYSEGHMKCSKEYLLSKVVDEGIYKLGRNMSKYPDGYVSEGGQFVGGGIGNGNTGSIMG